MLSFQWMIISLRWHASIFYSCMINQKEVDFFSSIKELILTFSLKSIANANTSNIPCNLITFKIPCFLFQSSRICWSFLSYISEKKRSFLSLNVVITYRLLKFLKSIIKYQQILLALLFLYFIVTQHLFSLPRHMYIHVIVKWWEMYYNVCFLFFSLVHR
jgi:hypothetical protein